MSNKAAINHNELIPLSEIRDKILSQYNLSSAEIETVKFKDTNKQRAVYKITNSSDCYCLKKVYYDKENLLYVYSVMEWLYRNDIHLPRLLPTLDRNRFVTYKNMIFILSPWIEGEKCDFDNPQHISISISTLANLHRVSKNFKPILGSSERYGLVDYHCANNKHFNQILENANNAYNVGDKFSKTYLQNLDYNIELAKLSLDVSSQINIDNLSRSLCHGDYVNKNIIIDNNDAWIIDFDKCQTDFSAHDLAYFLRRLLKRDGTNWNCTLTLNILYEYMETNRLNDSDIRYIVSYICFPQKFWKISRDYYKNIKRCNKASFQTLLERGIDKSRNQLAFANELVDFLSKKRLI